MVVKAFKLSDYNVSNLPDELSGMSFFKEVNFFHLNSPQPLAVAKCKMEADSFALLLETVAPGKRYNDAFEEMAELPSDGPEQKEAFEKYKTALAKAGAALGELQAVSPQILGPIPKKIFNRLDERRNKLNEPEIKAIISQDLDPNLLIEYLRHVKQAALDVDHYMTYNHGDGHMGNYFYNDEEDRFTMIDLERLHKTIDYEGNPRGSMGFDYVRFLEDLEGRAIGKITESQLEELKKRFQSILFANSGKIRPKSSKNYIMLIKN